jgi:hypothetical protein
VGKLDGSGSPSSGFTKPNRQLRVIGSIALKTVWLQVMWNRLSATNTTTTTTTTTTTR